MHYRAQFVSEHCVHYMHCWALQCTLCTNCFFKNLQCTKYCKRFQVLVNWICTCFVLQPCKPAIRLCVQVALENAQAYRGFIVGLVSVFFCVLVSGFGGVRVVVSAPTHDAIIISRVYKRMGLLCAERRTKTSRFQGYSVRKCLDKALEQGKAHVVVYLGALQSTVW